MKINEIIPTIGVDNLQTAVHFYEKIGFEKNWYWLDNNPTHASVSAGK